MDRLKPNILLLRGLARQKKHWADFPEQLTQRGWKHTLIDLPGFGDKYRDEAPDSISETTNLTREHWLKLVSKNTSSDTSKEKRPLWILGLSLGGMVTIDWITRFPGDFDHALIANSSMRPFNPPWERIQLPSLMRLTKSLFGKNPEKIEETIYQLTSTQENNDRHVIAAVELFRQAPPQLPNVMNQLMAASRYRFPKEIPDNLPPTDILLSLKDGLVSPECSKKLHEHTKWPIHFNEKAGHDLSLDDPEWLLNKLEEIFNTNN